MAKNVAVSAAKYLAIDLIGDILYWPLWWYSAGLLKTAKSAMEAVKNQTEVLGVNIWVKNIFTPMFGQYDIEGRIISFFARLIQIIVRSILLLVWVVLIIALFLLWIILPFLIAYGIYYQLTGLIL